MDEQLEALLVECFQGIGEGLIDVPEEMQVPHAFSRESRRKLRRMIRQACGGVTMPKLPRQHRLKYTIVLTVLIFLSLITAVSGAGRYLISGFFAEAFSDSTLVWNETSEDASQYITEVYLPMWLPEGYELVNVDNNQKSAYFQYRYCNSAECDHQSNEEHICFTQYTNMNYRDRFDNEQGDLMQITLGDSSGIEINYEDENIFAWRNEDYTFELRIPVDLDKDKAAEIVKYVQKVE